MTHSNTQRQTSLEVLGIIEDMPTLPDRFLRIQEVLDSDESTAQDLANIIQTDQATAATLLKFANSPYYNPLNKPVGNLTYAISRLGRKETGDIALSMALLYGFAIPAGIHLIRKFWAHAYAVGQIGRHLAIHMPKQDQPDPDTIFMAALLHDIGRVILGMRVDMAYFEHAFASADGQILIDAEYQMYGLNHAEAGEITLRQWGMHPDICQIVGEHHQLENTTSATKICILADNFAHAHLKDINSIEDVQAKIQAGLFEQITQTLRLSGVIPNSQA
ncbi:MAG: HDOD domain-containing protein [Mariprofundaceae bacterium]|nr:HDOD domain-containing protein [Mariprofundaceae bacterium]